MIPEPWRHGVVAVVGLGKSGVAATELLARAGVRVYASDASDHPYGGDALVHLGALAGVTLDVGRHDLARIRSAAAVIVSPGVPPEAAPLVAARAAGVPVLSEIDLGFRALAAAGMRSIAITGTNGKTTTTALVAHLLRAAGLAAEAAGNIGRPLADIAVRGDRYAWLAIEVSSFQLHDSPNFAPDIGILTNLAPDHLDRYPAVEAYYADKRQLFRNAADANVWVLNGDDPAVLELAAGAKGRRLLFSLARPADGWYDRADGAGGGGGCASARRARRCWRARSSASWAITTWRTRSPPRSPCSRQAWRRAPSGRACARSAPCRTASSRCAR